MSSLPMVSGGDDTIYEYVSFSVSANTPLNIPTSKKAKGLIFEWSRYSAIAFGFDGEYNNKLVVNGNPDSQTFTFSDNAITTDFSLSSYAGTYRGYIIY